METVFGRLRPTKMRRNQIPAPSKEDILSAIEGFEKENVMPGMAEDNNNLNSLKRRDSRDSVEGKWEHVSSAEVESMSTSASTAHSYSAEWERLFTRPDYFSRLRQLGIDGELRSSRFRSICWKIYLEVLSKNMALWDRQIVEWRLKYTELKDMLIVNPRKAVDSADLMLNNPLSQAEESPWNQFFQDNELRLTIKQDVIRTFESSVRRLKCSDKFINSESFPELQFFRSEEIRNLMIDILFCFCRVHPHISYKQGMHELLAPLIFVLHCDHQAFLHATELEAVQNKDVIKQVMDPKYLEHDAYAMFCQVMQTVEPWYVSKESPICRAKDIIKATPFSKPQDLSSSSVIVTKLRRIQDYILKKYDQELHGHLERLEIAPQIYGIRWVRLLFGREFPMQDLLMLWDAIFADGIGFDLVDYIFVAMLLYIRDVLLSSDYATCLTTLMKYPPVGDVHYFVDKALYLREPNQYPRPPNYTFQVTKSSRERRDEAKAHHTNKRHHHIMGGFSSFSRKFNRPKTLAVSSFQKKIPKSSSEPMNLQTDDITPSPASPPDQKRGSTASLSQVEDAMFRHVPSASSVREMAPMRSALSTPAGYSPHGFSTGDEGSAHSSPTKGSLQPPQQPPPNPIQHGRSKGRKLTKQELEIHHQISHLQGQLHDHSAMHLYCASKLDVHIDKLQSELLRQNLDDEDEIMLALAGIKQVRDVLNGTLKFSRNLMDEEEIRINDNHYHEERLMSPDSDPSSTKPASHTAGSKRKQRLFYMSSEENSEAPESPESNASLSVAPGHDMELDEFERRRMLGAVNAHGPQVAEPALLDAQTSSFFAETRVCSDTVEESPNPLYRLNEMDA